MFSRVLLALTIGLFASSPSFSVPPSDSVNYQTVEPDGGISFGRIAPGISRWQPQAYDTRYISVNRLLGFTTNNGVLFSDVQGLFGNAFGLYYPFTNISDIQSGERISSVIYSSGLWLGASVSGSNSIRIAVNDYSSECTPGPMSGSTYQPDQQAFRVYSLHKDSLYSSGNQDYRNWPYDQGAPSYQDEEGVHPRLTGDQMLWTVYNDADPQKHSNPAGHTPPLGVEVRQSIWAYHGVDTTQIPETPFIAMQAAHPPLTTVSTAITDITLLNSHNYILIIEHVGMNESYWTLKDLNTGLILRSHQAVDLVNPSEMVDGFQFIFSGLPSPFRSFQCTANAAGPLDPPEPGALGSLGFPTPASPGGSLDPTERQQALTDSRWAIHTGDDGTRARYSSFVERTTRYGVLNADLSLSDYEIRFTGSYEAPGINGSWANNYFVDYLSFWVPFEIWAIGQDTPYDTSDDYRMIPWTLKNAVEQRYGLENVDHSASPGADDPYTPWTYFVKPADRTPGQAGYLAAEAQMIAGTYAGDGDTESLARIVLVSLDGGTQPPYSPELPEQGTIFRILTGFQNIPPDTFYFTTPPPATISIGGESQKLYLQFDLFNKGTQTLTNMFASFWADPDVGGFGDDLVGCDTINDIFYAYNGDASDVIYGVQPAAVGLRLIQGPIVVKPGKIASFFGHRLEGFTNVGLYSFRRLVNGIDPATAQETYNYMWGLDSEGGRSQPRYDASGDPTVGTGVLDPEPGDRRFMASVGPFRMAPGDSQQVIFSLAVATGSGVNAHLDAVTKMKALLLTDIPCCTGTVGNTDGDPFDQIDISDLSILIDYLFFGGLVSSCADEVDGYRDGTIDITDLQLLIDYLFFSGVLPACPQ